MYTYVHICRHQLAAAATAPYKFVNENIYIYVCKYICMYINTYLCTCTQASACSGGNSTAILAPTADSHGGGGGGRRSANHVKGNWSRRSVSGMSMLYTCILVSAICVSACVYLHS